MALACETLELASWGEGPSLATQRVPACHTEYKADTRPTRAPGPSPPTEVLLPGLGLTQILLFTTVCSNRKRCDKCKVK